MEWNDETIARLRVFWDAGLSTAEIGRRLGVSKNAVVGKAHRMMLPARPSPIRRDGSGASRNSAPRRITGPTLPSLAAPLGAPAGAPSGGALLGGALLGGALLGDALLGEALPGGFASVGETRPESAPKLPVAASLSVEPASRPIRPASNFSGRLSACCWPLGDPGTPSFRFCDASALPGKPYCGDHAQVAYVKVRDRREEAA